MGYDTPPPLYASSPGHHHPHALLPLRSPGRAFRLRPTTVFLALLLLIPLSIILTSSQTSLTYTSLSSTLNVLDSSPSSSTIGRRSHTAFDGLPIVFALVMIGASSAREGVISIKSILMHSSKPVELHIICSQDAKEIIEESLAFVTRPRFPITVDYYVMQPGQGLDRAKRGGIAQSYHAGEGGILKLFMQEILPPSVGYAIFIDTDAIFAADPALLWEEIRYLEPDNLLSLTTAGPVDGDGTICSCTLLMNLNKMRAPLMIGSTLIPDTPHLDVDLSEWPTMDGLAAPSWGDQGFFISMLRHKPETIGEMSIVWDVAGCNGMRGMIIPQKEDRVTAEEQLRNQHHTQGMWEEGQLLFPGLVHLNCLDTPPGFNTWDETPEFPWALPDLIGHVVYYRWIWLNQYSHHATRAAPAVSQRTHASVRFADELISEGAYLSQKQLARMAAQKPFFA